MEEEDEDEEGDDGDEEEEEDAAAAAAAAAERAAQAERDWLGAQARAAEAQARAEALVRAKAEADGACAGVYAADTAAFGAPAPGSAAHAAAAAAEQRAAHASGEAATRRAVHYPGLIPASDPPSPQPWPVTYTATVTLPSAASRRGGGGGVSGVVSGSGGCGRARRVAAAASEAVASAEASGAAHARAAKGASLAFCASPSANLSHLRTAIAQHEADGLFQRRRYWYKPVAMLGGQIYSIAEGEALPFCLGKRMIAGNEGSTSRARGKPGFLVYDCASRALQAALVRPRGKLASATKAVLRVTATRPCAPADAQWPTAGGVWAFEVIVPVSIALEQQTWMEDKSLASLWLPAAPAGLCKQCALGERACVQVRNHLQMGQPPGMVARGPSKAHRPGGGAAGASAGGRGAACAGSGTVSYTAEGFAAEIDEPDDPEWALLPGEAPGLDLRSYV